MDLLAFIISIPILFGYIALLFVVGYRSRKGTSPRILWLIGLHIVAAVLTAATLLPEDIAVVLRLFSGALTVMTFGALMLLDITPRPKPRASLNGQPIQPHWLRLWLIVTGIWLVALLGGVLISGGANIGQPLWVTERGFDAASMVGVVGFLLVILGLLVAAFRAFYVAPLPEIANRSLFWVVLSGGLSMSMLLGFTGTLLFTHLGDAALLLTVSGAVYAVLNYRVFNIRASLRQSFVTILLTALSTVLLLMALYAIIGLNIEASLNGLAVLSLIALAIALVYIPVRRILEFVLSVVIRRKSYDPAQLTREFSKRVYQAVNLKEVVAAATESLNTMMGIRRSGVMLVNRSLEHSVELLAIEGGSFGADMKGVTLRIPLQSSLYHTLAKLQRPVTQFDLEHSPHYVGLSEDQLRFLNELNMSAYAPVIMDAVFVGLLMVGAKEDDSAFSSEDLMLLSTMAQQTGFALRNSRLVADLKHLNDSMRSLNKGLEEANKELERLDAVKSDFVTIASHELRTPLAQIRGYTDMIDSLNDAGMLESDQVTGMVLNLRKAAERMEELIAAMLDVSQLDVDAMDLRFAKTTPETVLRMAIEPLTNEIKQRKLNLTGRWKGLPPIQADLQRLVQAFRNIVVNAIKFTPDGGSIEIVASLQPAKRAEDVDHILVTIADTGVGIDEENLDLVFKKFFRTYDPSLHSTGSYKFLGAGPGLGLTIAKGVIEAHGGRIWAESPGHSLTEFPGTTFYVLLPVSPTDDSKRSLTFESEIKPPADKGKLNKAATNAAAKRKATQEVKKIKTDRLDI